MYSMNLELERIKIINDTSFRHNILFLEFVKHCISIERIQICNIQAYFVKIIIKYYAICLEKHPVYRKRKKGRKLPEGLNKMVEAAKVPEEPTRRKAYIMSVYFYELMSKVLLYSAI